MLQYSTGKADVHDLCRWDEALAYAETHTDEEVLTWLRTPGNPNVQQWRAFGLFDVAARMRLIRPTEELPTATISEYVVHLLRDGVRARAQREADHG